MKKNIGALRENRTLCSILGTRWAGLLAFLSIFVLADIAHAESFTPPYSGILYLQCVGGSAGATSQFGLGSSPDNFTPYLTNLPAGCPDTEVKVGPVTAGQAIDFGISTLWLGQTYWAFSFNTDEGSTVAFNDVCNSLGMNGKIIQQTGTATWLMHLNDAAHYTISQCEANNILIQIRLAASNTCSLQSLTGAYSYAFNGSSSTRGNVDKHGFSAVGVFVSDGNGNLTGTDTTSKSGEITPGRTYTGTYTANADCTGTATFPGIGQMFFALSNNNQNVNFIQTDPGSDLLGTAQQQFH